uniref:Putative leucine-rich repeat receptor-like protein kinase n=1 Tax=Populus alba TaxID=43335 RepID=A0A4V6ABV3_POPAL|nr:putative leucine-rich repeat receptor-like protein kinase [Populus alba]
MGPRILVFLVVALSQVCTIPAMTDGADFTALKALKDIWKNVPPTWVGADPCGSRWEGILCANSRVTSITLASMGLKGSLSGDIQSLSELQILDLSYNKGLSGPLPSAIGDLKKLTNLVLVGCSFCGPIPDSIGSLPLLASLSLNSNGFTGSIPPSIGNLTSLYLLDLADNRLTGTIPVSTATTPGLDLLVHTKHFHLGLNQLSGTIPPKLFSSEMKLIHVLFESNKLTGSIPSTLGLVKTLEVVRLDNNSFRGSVPSDINNLTSVSTMFLSNNDLTGPLPNLTGMHVLTYLDMSNNSFDDTKFPPWFSTLQSLTTLVMETTQLQGQIPADFFSLSHLETVDARNNQLSGSLDIGTGHGNQLALIDLRKNKISAYTTRLGGEGVSVILADNPICRETGVTKSYCTVSQPNSSYATPPNNCVPASCFATQHSSPNCKCAFPYTGLLVFRAPSFSDLGNITYFSVLEKSLMNSFKSHQFPVDSVRLSQPRKDLSQYLDLNLQVFPFGQDRFNRTAISSIGFMLSSLTFKPPAQFGPFFFIGDTYLHFTGEVRGSKKSSSTGAIIGAAAGGSVLLLLLLGAGLYAFGQKKKAEKAIQQNNPFAHWESKNGVVSVPQLKGARCFSFEELKKYTNNFSETIDIGSGGYGKVKFDYLSPSLKAYHILSANGYLFAFDLSMFMMY